MMNERDRQDVAGDETGFVAENSAPAPRTGSDQSEVEPLARLSQPGSGSFWACGEGIHALDDPTPFGQENALQKLGKPPFEKTPRGRFRLLGYLATVYEHVSQDVRRAEDKTATAQSGEGGGSE